MLLFLHGNDAYRLELATKDAIVSRHAQPDASPHVVRVDCADNSAAEEIERHLKYPSFFGDATTIVAHHAACELFGTVLDNYAIATLEDVIVVAVQDTSLKGFDKKVFAKLQKMATLTSEHNRLTGSGLTAWMRDYCARLGGSMDTTTAGILVKTVGEDSRIIAAELEKLIAYAGRESVSPSMITTLACARPERDEWELSNAIASHDKRAIVASLWRKVQEGTPEQLLIGSVAAGFRNLIMVRNLLDRTCAPAAIAAATGLHPFVISKTLRGANITDTSRLTRSHTALALLDRHSKEGIADATDGLFDIVLGL